MPQGLLAIIHLAKKDAVCFDLGKAGAVQLLAAMWPQWDDDEMRQLLLWAMNEVARIGMRSKRPRPCIVVPTGRCAVSARRMAGYYTDLQSTSCFTQVLYRYMASQSAIIADHTRRRSTLYTTLAATTDRAAIPKSIDERQQETNQLRMSAERVGALLRETMEPAAARFASTGAMITAEQAGHYCVPIKLKRLYRERKLGSPFAKGDADACRYGRLVSILPPNRII